MNYEWIFCNAQLFARRSRYLAKRRNCADDLIMFEITCNCTWCPLYQLNGTFPLTCKQIFCACDKCRSHYEIKHFGPNSLTKQNEHNFVSDSLQLSKIRKQVAKLGLASRKQTQLSTLDYVIQQSRFHYRKYTYMPCPSFACMPMSRRANNYTSTFQNINHRVENQKLSTGTVVITFCWTDTLCSEPDSMTKIPFHHSKP